MALGRLLPPDGNDGWWFEIAGDTYGPYDTKKEAKDELRGLRNFFGENPEYINVENANVDVDDEPTARKGANNTMATKKKTTTSSSNPFASKLGDDAGARIEKMYMDGKTWKEMAAELGVSVSSVRFRFLDFLLKATYEDE